MSRAHILICAHPSSRFPGKNEVLFGYTKRYIDQNADVLKENDCDVWSIGWKSEIPQSMYPHIEFHSDSHKEVVGHFAEWSTRDELIIILQLTQPLRSENLLKDAFEHHKESDEPCFSYAGTDLGVIDGAIYTARAGDYEAIFDKSRRHHWLHNAIPEKVDIDHPEDMATFKRVSAMISQKKGTDT